MDSDIDSETVAYDAEAGLYRTTYDAHTPPSVAIPTAMAEITGTEIAELDPTHDVLDLESLDDLFRPTAGGFAERGGRMSFSFQSHRITVFGDDLITIRPPNGSPEGDDSEDAGSTYR